MAGKDAPPLAVTREQLGPHGCAIVARGAVDLYSAAGFQTALAAAIDEGEINLLIDLTEVEFIDSTGFGVLVGASKRLRLLGGTLAIVSPDELMRRVVEAAGLTDRFSVYESRAAWQAAIATH